MSSVETTPPFRIAFRKLLFLQLAITFGLFVLAAIGVIHPLVFIAGSITIWLTLGVFGRRMFSQCPECGASLLLSGLDRFRVGWDRSNCYECGIKLF
jgi:hypothetical protein